MLSDVFCEKDFGSKSLGLSFEIVSVNETLYIYFFYLFIYLFLLLLLLLRAERFVSATKCESHGADQSSISGIVLLNSRCTGGGYLFELNEG